MSPQEHRICEKTGKRCYDSEKGIHNNIRTLSYRVRAYRCKFCNCWHFTKEAHYATESEPPKPHLRKRKPGKKLRKVRLIPTNGGVKIEDA